MKLHLDNSIWIRYTSYGYMTGMTEVIELRKDFFIREASFLTGKEPKFYDWIKLEVTQKKLLLEHLKKVDFESLKDEYADHDVLDGGESCFEIYDRALAKKITMINYYGSDDALLTSLQEVIDLLYDFV